ncbi:MAG TPA: hypothetical protein PLD25_28590 [Chloroflexota bacterium]|nr:hypothetical protein [Chloroflexota bacterium]HUM71232.1 hypothetical protein [Chloroflexota bacterium]
MKSRMLFTFVLLGLLAVLLAACGSKNATINDIPAYPNASALQPGQDPIADTLVNNMQQDASLRANMGVGGSIEQMAYRLPEGATWDQVKSYYDKELDSAGWDSGMGGPGGSLASGILESVNTGNDLFQMASWNKGKQILTLIRNVNPTNESEVYLLMSLNTN